MAATNTPTRRILWVDDDQYFIQPFRQKLQDSGFDVICEMTATWGLRRFLKTRYRFCCVILDMAMPPGDDFMPIDTHGGYQSGLALARRMHAMNRDMPIIAFTNMRNASAEAFFADTSSPYIIKADISVNEFRDLVRGAIDPKLKRNVRTFIVHGHDASSLLELKNCIQNNLGLGEPVVLRDEPHGGMTIIEKFEKYATFINIVFVLLTPDDQVVDQGRRARQNVIFELGYFYGKLQRKRGRVIMLHKGCVDLPSNIAGIGYIDVSCGIQAAGERIRRELHEWL